MQHSRTDIERHICEELRLTYPLPFILPEEMTWKYINQYLDEQNQSIVCKLVKVPKLIPIGEPRKDSTDAYYLDVIFRLPWVLCFLYMPFIVLSRLFHKLLRFAFKQPYTNVSPVKRHRYQPAFYFRLPLFPGIVSMVLTTLWQTVVFYLIDKFRDFTVSGIAKNLLKSFAFHYLVSVILRGNSIVLPPEMMADVYRVLDPLGETG